MKMHAVLLPLVTLCLLLAVVPAMAGPIPFTPPSGAGSTVDSFELSFPGADFLSTLHSEAPSGLSPSDPGSYKVIGAGGGPPDPPTPNPQPAPEPSGIMVMFGSVLFGVSGLWRGKLKDLI